MVYVVWRSDLSFVFFVRKALRAILDEFGIAVIVAKDPKEAYSSLRYNRRGPFFLPFWAFCDPCD
jgi:hypothetical protein